MDPLEAEYEKVVLAKSVALAMLYHTVFENSKKLNVKHSTAIFVKRDLSIRADKFSRSIFGGLFFNFKFFFDEF